MTLQIRKIASIGLLLTSCCLLWSCQEQPTATVKDLSKPLPASPTPTPPPVPPAVNTRRTDLDRVVMGVTPPDFALEDMNKKIVRLSDFRGKQTVILVFYRGHF
jgi:cytochrome oxidase Cu insertion factor (SCO1/SenC/PrrC family)